MFKLLRYYSAASLLAIVGTAVLLIWLYRHVAVQGTVQLAERSNLNVAQASLTPIRTQVLEFLAAAARAPSGPPPRLPPELARSIDALMQDKFVVRVKIFNRDGVVLFSTNPNQIGLQEGQSDHFLAAVHGGVATAVIDRDSLDALSAVTGEDVFAETYLPIRASPSEPIQGVFELYADVNNLVHYTERMQFLGVGGAIAILLGLYGVLVLVVRRASKTIEQQQLTIQERNKTLELLSAHMLKREETGKQQIAHELHEGVAQTLAALKLQLESSRHTAKLSQPRAAADPLVPVLQQTIEDVRGIATQLRPASLDDLGLVPTLQGFCREYQQTHPHVTVQLNLSVQETDVPAALGVILYRIITSVLGDVASRPGPSRIDLRLRAQDDELVLLLVVSPPVNSKAGRSGCGLARMEELAILSGGEFTQSAHGEDATALQAVWTRSDNSAAMESAQLARFL